MKKYAAIGAVVLAAIVAAIVPGTALASTCGANYEWNGGATAVANPGIGVGNTATANLNYTGTLSLGTSGSQLFNRIVLYDTQTGETATVGLVKTTNNPQLRTYIAVNGHIDYQSNASVGSTYSMSIDHTGTTSWVLYDGNGDTELVTGLTTREWFFESTVDQGTSGGTCPVITSHILNVSPFNFNNSPPWYWDAAVSPYSYTSQGNTGFGFTGP